MKKTLLPVVAVIASGLFGATSSAFAQTPTPMPYIVDLSQTNDGWTNFNFNEDNESWMFFEGMGTGMASQMGDADDAFVSPGVVLEKGKKYKIAARVQLFNDVSDRYRLAITAGKSIYRNDQTPVKQFEFKQQGINIDSLVYTPEETGTYYFGFYNTTEADITNGAVILNAFGIDEYTEPITSDVVLDEDLSAVGSLGAWTVADANGDNATWGVVSGIEGITYDSDKSGAQAANDWLFSPAFDVKAGEDYLVSYAVKRQGAFDPDVLELYFGSNATAEGMTLLSTESVDVNAETVTRTVRLSCKESGSVHLGFHLATPSAENGQLSLLNVNVKATEKTTPTPVENFKAVSSHKEKTVTLSWNNPTFDTKGIAINDLLSVKLYGDDEPITTLNDLKAGEQSDYTFSPTAFGGNVTYKAVAMIGENEATAVAVTINLDDVQGDTVTVKAFDVDYATAAEWKTEGTHNAWKHEYQNVFTYDYRQGSKYNDEWLISPLTELKADRRYVVMYELKTSQDYANNVEVTIGNAQEADAQTRVIASYYGLKQNGFAVYATNQFALDEDGNYCIGFHVTSNGYYVNMRNLRICYIDENGTVNAINNVSFGANAATVEVYDTMGRCLNRLNNATVSEALSTLRSGVYVVRTTDSEGNTQTVKITK